MKQNNSSLTPITSVSIAGGIGCLIAIGAFGSLALGLVIDQVVLNGQRHWGVLFCVVAGVPLNLALIAWVTRRVIARYNEPTQLVNKQPAPADKAASEE